MNRSKKMVTLLVLMLAIMVLPLRANAAVRISRKNIVISTQQTYQLKVKGTKKKVKWSSSDKAVAKVSKKGKVTAVAPGKAVITARTANGKKVKCKVTVKSAAPADAVYFNGNGHYYKLFNRSLTWKKAKRYCEKIHGHLVTVTSQEEQDFIRKLADQYAKKYYFFLGGTDAGSEGNWRWVTGEPWKYEGWDRESPNNSTSHDPSGQNYLIASHVPNVDSYWYQMLWDDQPNDGTSGDPAWSGAPYYQVLSKYGFICEWDS